MAESGTNVVWPEWLGFFDGQTIYSGDQPLAGGDASQAVPFSNRLENPPILSWGSLKSSGILRSAFGRLNFADPDGLGFNVPDPQSTITRADLEFTVSSATASIQANLFDSKISIVRPDGQWSEDPFSIVPAHGRGTACAGFLARDTGGNPIGGRAPTFVQSEVLMNAIIVVGSNRVGQAFEVGPGGTTLEAVEFMLGRAGLFAFGENYLCEIYPSQANDGSNDAPLVSSVPIGAPSDPLGMFTLPAIGAEFRVLTFSTPVVLPEGRFVALLRGDWGVPNGRALRVGLGATTQALTLISSRYVSISAGVNSPFVIENISDGFLGPGYPTAHDLPQVFDSVGGLLGGTARELPPLALPATWPSPLVGPFASATPAFPTVGVRVSVDVIPLMQAYIDREDYIAEFAASDGGLNAMPLGYCLGYDIIDADHEREASTFRLVMDWVKSSTGICGTATQTVGARAKADSTVVQRAIATQAVTQRGKADGTTPQRGQAQHSVDQRGKATMTVCEK